MGKQWRELLEHIAADKNLLKCYQCGTCVGGCPVARASLKYNPRRILEELITGGGSKLLSDDLVWLCANCHSCLEKCPQRIGLSHIFVELKNAASMMGNIPTGILDEAKQLMRSGRTTPFTKAAKRRRAELKLPSVPPSAGVEEIGEIVRATQLNALINGARKPKGGGK
ncbi:MAG: 4Fe-4S dicluster domain-containing protein [Candidatus Geothermarchaeales archaeon]